MVTYELYDKGFKVYEHEDIDHIFEIAEHMKLETFIIITRERGQFISTQTFRRK